MPEFTKEITDTQARLSALQKKGELNNHLQKCLSVFQAALMGNWSRRKSA